MARKIIWIALLACFLISPLSFAADVEVDLTTANGSTAFEVQDSGNNAVMSVASNGNTRIKGSWGILEGGAAPTRYSIFQGGDQAADITYTLPTADAAGALTSNGAGVLSWTAGGGGATAWDAIGDATADGTIANGAFETDFTSTLDSASKAFLTITNTDADTAADTDFISLVHNDGADANIFYFRAVGDADGAPQTDYRFSQTAALIRPALTVTEQITGNAGLAVANGATSSGFVDIFEDTDDGANKTRFQSVAMVGDITYSLPPDDGDAGEQLQTNGAGVLTWESAGSGSTAWDAIGDATADGAIANGAFETDFTSTLDSAGKAFLTVTNTTADGAADTDFISLVHNDGADANVFYFRAVGDADGTPQTDYRFSQTAALIRPDLTVTGLVTSNAGLATTNGATSAGFVDIFEDTDDGANKTRFQAAAQAGDITYTLPATNVAAPLMNNGSGTLSWSNTGLPVEFIVAVSDETTALTTGTSKITFRMPYAMTLTAVRANVITAPTGSTVIVDINETGSGTVLSTRLSIDAGAKTSTTAGTPAVISDSALADDAEITIDIDQVGSTVAGVGLKVLFKGTRA